MFTPKFKNHFHVEILEPDFVFLLSEDSYQVLTGRLYVALAPLLNGQNTAEEIIQKLKDQAPFMQVQHTLSRLRQRGYITDVRHEHYPPEFLAQWEALGVEAKEVHERLHAKHIQVKTFGSTDGEALVNALQALHVQVTEEDPDLVVALTDDYLQTGLAQLNQQMQATRTPWMLAKPNGIFIWMGPIFTHGTHQPCWECLENRLTGIREVDHFLKKKKNVTDPFPVTRAGLPSSKAVAINMIANEILKWIVLEENPQLENCIASLDTTNLDIEFHHVTYRPQCLVCGEEQYRTVVQAQPIHLAPRAKGFTSDGGHRLISPDETYERFQHHISPITGIITNLHLRLEEDGLVYIFGSAHILMLKHNSWESLRNSLFLRSAGKGKSEAQAKASAIGESLERYSAVFQGYEPRITATYEELGDEAIHPHSVLLYSENQYQNRHKWLELGYVRHLVHARFDETRPVEWTPVWSLTNQEFKYIPTAFCYYGYWDPDEPAPFCFADSNGSASGNCPEEAILQGYMEAIERDAIAIWWYNRVKRPRIDLDSFGDPYFQQIQEFYHRRGYNMWMLDLTHDLGIPVVGAFASNADGGEIAVGFGAHLDPYIAAARALTEVNEMYAAIMLNKSSDDGDRLKDQEIGNWLKNATIETEYYLVPNDTLPMRTYDDLPKLHTDDLRDDVMKCVDILAQFGLETFVLNQTRPDVGMDVYKVIVPELRHFWARFAPGRLYDVPVKLGWLETPVPEEDLNSTLMFF